MAKILRKPIGEIFKWQGGEVVSFVFRTPANYLQNSREFAHQLKYVAIFEHHSKNRILANKAKF